MFYCSLLKDFINQNKNKPGWEFNKKKLFVQKTLEYLSSFISVSEHYNFLKYTVYNDPLQYLERPHSSPQSQVRAKKIERFLKAELVQCCLPDFYVIGECKTEE